MKIMTIVLATVASAMLAIGAITYAQTGPTGATGPTGVPGPTGQMMGNGPHHTQMMIKLVAACTGKKANDPCSFTRANGSTANGTCTPRHDQLLCMPSYMMHHGAMGGMGASGGMGNMGGGMMTGSPSGATGPTGQ